VDTDISEGDAVYLLLSNKWEEEEPRVNSDWKEKKLRTTIEVPGILEMHSLA
jgi:hypothetical protein